ncbi:MAG TPA: cell surface protein SprA, partial [Ginsengibacter sp.]|nr:cell surface protein SprA [Ginsengibacter sp.]
ANLELGKLLPKEAGLSIPFFASVSQITSAPEYDPFDKDLRLKEKLRNAQTAHERDSIRKNAVDYANSKTVSFTNVHKNRTNDKKPQLWDIENFDFSYAFTKTEARSPLIEYNIVTKQRGGFAYNFAPQPKFIEPFKKVFKKGKTHWFDLIKDFNFNPIPNQISFKADIFRQFGAIKPRSIGVEKYPTPETFDKYFTFDRNYIFKWQLTRSLNLDYMALNNARIDEPYGRIDTKPKKDTIRKNFWKGGRNVAFNQTASISYSVPLSKFPITDWTTLDLRYTANYRWLGASRLAVDLGNFLENGQQEEANLQMDFTKLYSKSKWLRSLDEPRKQEGDTSQKAVGAGNSGVLRAFGKLLTSIKTVTGNLSLNSNTRLPGYTDSTQFIGQDFKSMAPGLDFVFGAQPDTNWLNRAAAKGLITRDSNFNDLFVQSFDQRLALGAQLEPVRDLIINLNLEKTFSKRYSETFKDTTGSGGAFSHLSPYASGSFNVTYIAFNTLFEKYDPNRISATFSKFEEYRSVISKRLGEQNKYNQQAGNPINPDGYALGYGRYAVDVLVPAFLAAYTGQDPSKVSLIRQQNENIKSNPFRNIMPKPNWRISYTGLSRIPGLDKIFNNFTLNHAYTASVGMNNFTSALRYQDIDRFNYPSFIDSVSGNYIPYFLIPNITIQEQFGPLLGIDMGFTNQLNLRFDFNKSRQLSLSLVDFQLSEVRSTEYTFSGSYRKRGMKLPFRLPFMKSESKTLENEIRFQLDVRIRDNVTSNSRLDQQSSFATNGSKEISLSPTIDYYISNRVNVKFYFDQRRINPYISSSAPTVDTRAGVQIRVSLSQ